MASKHNQINHFIRDQDGISAVEFALCLPLLVFLYFGVLSAFETTQAARQVAISTAAVADVTSRNVDVTEEQIDLLFATGNSLLPDINRFTRVEKSISSVINPPDPDAALDYEVAWSRTTSSALELETETLGRLTIPEIPEGGSIVIVMTETTYMPFFSVFGLKSSIAIERVALRRPRFAPQVAFLD